MAAVCWRGAGDLAEQANSFLQDHSHRGVLWEEVTPWLQEDLWEAGTLPHLEDLQVDPSEDRLWEDRQKLQGDRDLVGGLQEEDLLVVDLLAVPRWEPHWVVHQESVVEPLKVDLHGVEEMTLEDRLEVLHLGEGLVGLVSWMMGADLSVEVLLGVGCRHRLQECLA